MCHSYDQRDIKYVHGAMNTRRKILVVDDDATNVQVIKGLLDRLGHEVISAGNGLDALKLLDPTFGNRSHPSGHFP